MLAGARDEGCLSDAGIYNWNIAADLITGDAAVAYLFGLDPDAAYQGLSMGRYLERIHEDDRSDVVEAIHTAVLCSGTLQMQFRTLTVDGEYLEIIAFGRCFLDRGEQKFMSGVLHALPREGSDATALDHLIAAHALFERQGAQREAGWVVDLMARIVDDTATHDNVIHLTGE